MIDQNVGHWVLYKEKGRTRGKILKFKLFLNAEKINIKYLGQEISFLEKLSKNQYFPKVV